MLVNYLKWIPAVRRTARNGHVDEVRTHLKHKEGKNGSVIASTQQIRVERQYEIRPPVIIRGYRKQACLLKARWKVIRDTHASEEQRLDSRTGLNFH